MADTRVRRVRALGGGESFMFDLAEEYQSFAQAGAAGLRLRGADTDEEMFPPEGDARRGLGLYFFQEKIRLASQPVLQILAREFPDEFVVYGLPGSPARQHVTFLELMEIRPPADFAREIRPVVPRFIEALEPVLHKLRSIRARFKGIVANESTIVLKGYPEDQSYNATREALRAAIVAAGLPVLNRRQVRIFHTTIARFRRPVHDVERLLALVAGFGETDFGAEVYSDLRLATGSVLMAESQIAEFYAWQCR